MSEDLHAELTNMMGPIQWEYLKPHVQRDAVVIVNEHLNLADVGVAIASNNTQAVERWITEQLIVKPNTEQLTLWSAQNKTFTSVIVQPYVLIQDAPTDAPGATASPHTSIDPAE
ncbi:MAG: DUF2288 domain-containing protein [Cyanobacteria bacterium J06588_5]